MTYIARKICEKVLFIVMLQGRIQKKPIKEGDQNRQLQMYRRTQTVRCREEHKGSLSKKAIRIGNYKCIDKLKMYELEGNLVCKMFAICLSPLTTSTDYHKYYEYFRATENMFEWFNILKRKHLCCNFKFQAEKKKYVRIIK